MSSVADSGRMKNTHRPLLIADVIKRLNVAIEITGMSKRAISLASGNGAGYVHSITSDGKEPTIGNLARVCAALEVSLSFILYGVDISEESEKIISLLEKNPEKRDAILHILRN